MRLVLRMYASVRSWVRVGEGFSQTFEVKAGVHQGSVLSPLLFIMVLEALHVSLGWCFLGGPICR